MIPSFKKKTLLKLKKAQGMLKKVIDMVEKDEYCIDVLQQSLAVSGFMKSANKTLLENHLNSCFKAGMKGKDEQRQEKLIGEVMHIVDKCK